MPRSLAAHARARIPYKTDFQRQEMSTMAGQSEGGGESFPKNESTGEGSNSGNDGEGKGRTAEGGEGGYGEGRTQDNMAGQGTGQIEGASGERETSR
ncbi:MAG TPA: hypothetical protein VM936_05860 [Pyrinomonadaceae bacterium]|nr:hypothetical protein [Pyrinomonadaceae bacterium]